MIAFWLTPDQAMLFYEVCHEMKADTEAKRLQIMEVMVAEGFVTNVVETGLTKEEYVKHLSQQFGNVMNISSKEPPTNA